jgi:hypothetical protein
MKKNYKILQESGKAIVTEAVTMAGNTLRNCKLLGWVSRNNRIYPKDVIGNKMHLYEGAIVNIDHPTRDGPRKYEDRFGRIVNVRMEQDGLYGDLVYNPEHPLAKSFKWWAENDPKAIGLSHNVIAKTKYDRNGYETISDLDRVEAVEVVSDPGTTNGLFEHYHKSLENNMSKDTKEDLVRKLDKGQEIKIENEDDNVPDKKDDDKEDMDVINQKEEKSGMDFFEDGSKQGMNSCNSYVNSPKSLAEYVDGLKTKFFEVVGDEDKVMKLLDMLDLREDQNSMSDAQADRSVQGLESKNADGEDDKHSNPKDKMKDDEVKPKDDVDNKKKAEEALRTSPQAGYKQLLEELDLFRLQAKRNELSSKATEICNKSGLPSYAITECFVDTLISSDENSWKTLVEDRKRVVFHTKKPISTGVVDNKLTVDSLVKQLTQE